MKFRAELVPENRCERRIVITQFVIRITKLQSIIRGARVYSISVWLFQGSRPDALTADSLRVPVFLAGERSPL